MEDPICKAKLMYLYSSVKEICGLLHLAIVLFDYNTGLTNLLGQACVRRRLLSLLVDQLHWTNAIDSEQSTLIFNTKILSASTAMRKGTHFSTTETAVTTGLLIEPP